MTGNQGHPEVETCGLCGDDRIRLSTSAIVCKKCDLISGKVPA
jgi:hypothetical protein